MASRPDRRGPRAVALGCASLIAGAALGGCGGPDQIADTNRAPQVTVDSPTSGAQFQPGPLFIELRADDADAYDTSEKLTVELRYSQAGDTASSALTCVGGNTRPGTSGVFTCTTDHSFDVGSYTLTARAQDTRGTFSQPVNVPFTIKNDLPTCTFQTPASGSTQTYDQEVPILMLLQCSDPDGEISQGEVCLNSDVNGFLGCDQPSSNGAAQLQVEFSIAGTHVVTATVTDEVGGTGQDSFTAVVSACGDDDDDGFYSCDSRDPENPPDCDDDDPLAFPGNTEVCDGRDSNCDGRVDNIEDIDGDGYLCDDCDNTLLSINPGGTEACNGKDDDCDGTADEDFDHDHDTYLSSCAVGGKGIDCDDANAATNPGAAEVCNGVDTNCNNIIDDKDSDKDGWVDSACVSYTGQKGGDCDDNNVFYNPAIAEVCDGHDEDCDGRIDNDTPCFDDDGDGYCEANCTNGGPDGDCDDTFAWTYPGAVERFDWRDNDCDGNLESRTITIEKAWLKLDGFAISSQAGKSLSGGDDVNGDGIDDLIIGAPNYDASGGGNQRGLAVVVHGRDAWDVGQALDLSKLTGAYQYTESRNNAQAGASVAIVGDMNGDSISEFAVGAPLADVTIPGFTLVDAGSAYVLLGKSTGWGNTTLSTAVSRVDGIADGVLVGTSLAGGDINGDSLADLIIGSPQPTDGVTAGAGWAFIFTGRYSGYPTTAGPQQVFQLQGSAGQAMGRSVAVIGTHDGDGIADLVIAGDADASNRGIVVRIPGAQSFLAGNRADISEVGNGFWSGEATGEEVGFSVDGGVDVDGNCYDDLLIGRNFLNIETADAMAYLILGKNGVALANGYAEDLATVKFLPQADDNCPCTVAAVGDMNGDGLGDFAIAAAHANIGDAQGAGRVYLFYGRDGGACETPGSSYQNPWPAEVDVAAEADGIFYGTVEHQRIGFTLEGLGDINHDGYDDLGIGAPFYSPDHGSGEVYQAGRVYVQFGSPTP